MVVYPGPKQNAIVSTRDCHFYIWDESRGRRRRENEGGHNLNGVSLGYKGNARLKEGKSRLWAADRGADGFVRYMGGGEEENSVAFSFIKEQQLEQQCFRAIGANSLGRGRRGKE